MSKFSERLAFFKNLEQQGMQPKPKLTRSQSDNHLVARTRPAAKVQRPSPTTPKVSPNRGRPLPATPKPPKPAIVRSRSVSDLCAVFGDATPKQSPSERRAELLKLKAEMDALRSKIQSARKNAAEETGTEKTTATHAHAGEKLAAFKQKSAQVTAQRHAKHAEPVAVTEHEHHIDEAVAPAATPESDAPASFAKPFNPMAIIRNAMSKRRQSLSDDNPIVEAAESVKSAVKSAVPEPVKGVVKSAKSALGHFFAKLPGRRAPKQDITQEATAPIQETAATIASPGRGFLADIQRGGFKLKQTKVQGAAPKEAPRQNHQFMALFSKGFDRMLGHTQASAPTVTVSA